MRTQVLNPSEIKNPVDKICYSCHNKKLLIEFNKCKTGVYGHHNHCRDCQKACKAKWDKKNSDWIKEYSSKPEIKKANLVRLKELYRNNPQWRNEHLQKNRNRRRLEPAKVKARIQRANWLKIPQNKIAQNLRKRIQNALKNVPKIISTEQITGCSFGQLKTYLESLFLPNMSWDNYGQWHVDHIKPCASFDLTLPDEQIRCFHYSNLQPLWAKDNLSKGSKVISR